MDLMPFCCRKSLARDNMKNMQPLGYCGEVDEMARLFAFMISEENTFMTGATIVADGGFALQPPKLDDFELKASE